MSEPSAAEVIGTALGDISEPAPDEPVEEAVEETGEEQPEAEAEPEPQPEAPKGDTKGKAFLNPALFTEEALATPEGIATARKAIQAREAYTNQTYIRMQDRNAKSKERDGRSSERERASVALNEAMSRDWNAIRSAGNANEALTALSRLTGRNGLEVYEELTAVILGQRKNKPDPTAEVKTELQQLKEQMRQREQRELENSNAAAATEHTRRIEARLTDETAFPAVAHFAKQSPEKKAELLRLTIAELNTGWLAQCGPLQSLQSRAFAAGNQGLARACADAIAGVPQALNWLRQNAPDVTLPQPLDHAVAIGNLETQLAPHLAGQTGVTPDAGRATSRNPKPVNGRTISPTRASAASVTRTVDDLSDEERLAAVARDTDYLRRIGLQ